MTPTALGDLCFDPEPARAPWLLTLADLALLLIGTLLLFQALGREPPQAVAATMRQGFAGQDDMLPVAAAALDGFRPGSAALPGDPAALAAWARDAVRDPRITVTLTGSSDGSAADLDPATGSGAALAVDRARGVLAALVARGVPADRLQLAARTGGERAVTATLAFSQPGRP